MKKSHLISLILLTALLFSCRPASKSPYQQGVQLLKNDTAAAEEAFLKAIAENDNRPQACLEYAKLCATQQTKYPLAIYYYGQYLEHCPEAENAAEIQAIRLRLKKSLALAFNQKFGEDVMDEHTLRIKLLEQHSLKQKQWIEELTIENQKLRNEIIRISKESK